MSKKAGQVLFEVLRDGRVLMSTEYKSCIYPNKTLLAMQAAGYKFRMDGKAWRPAKPEKKQLERPANGRSRMFHRCADIFSLYMERQVRAIKTIFQEDFIMAKVTIAGNSYVITSDVSMADLETVKKYRPSALALTDPETKETLFKVGVGSSSMNDYGISFGGVSNGEDKLATATLTIPSDVEDAKEYVLDKAGLAIANLGKVEAGIADALEDIRAERDTIAANIRITV